MEQSKSEISLRPRKNQHLWEDPFEVLLVILDSWAKQVQYPDLTWRNISPVPSVKKIDRVIILEMSCINEGALHE